MGRLIHIVSSNSWGGKERYVLDICRYYRSRGVSVSVYTRDARVIDDEFRSCGIDMRHAPLGGIYDVASMWKLATDLRHEPEGAIVHVHRFRDAFMALVARRLIRRKDIKVVYTHHTAKPGYNSSLARKVYFGVDKHIFVSEIACRVFLSSWGKDGQPFPATKISVIHNSIYESQPLREDEPQSGPVIAMFHGRLSPEKGVETLIDALPQLKGCRTRLWIVGVGDPDYVDKLKRKALSIGVFDMIDWKGYVKSVHELIPQSHFGVLPSLWEEGFGLANIEFMSHGRPQVCSNNGAQPEYLTDKEAIMVRPGDVESLGKALVRLAGDSDLRRNMGRNAHERFLSTLSWNNFCKSLDAVYQL